MLFDALRLALWLESCTFGQPCYVARHWFLASAGSGGFPSSMGSYQSFKDRTGRNGKMSLCKVAGHFYRQPSVVLTSKTRGSKLQLENAQFLSCKTGRIWNVHRFNNTYSERQATRSLLRVSSPDARSLYHILHLDGRNHAIVVAEPRARAIAAIRITHEQSLLVISAPRRHVPGEFGCDPEVDVSRQISLCLFVFPLAKKESGVTGWSSMGQWKSKATCLRFHGRW